MKRAIIMFLSLALSVSMLVGCGGSSQQVSNNPAQTKAQGVYVGTAQNTGGSNPYSEAIILPDDRLYAVYGNIINNMFVIDGFLVGQGTSNHGQYAVTDVRDYQWNGDLVHGSFSASYVPGQSISGTFKESGVSMPFTASVPPKATFVFDQPALLTDLAQPWTSFIDLFGNYTTPTFESDGTVSGGILVHGTGTYCDYSGRLTPDSGGKNFFQVTVTFTSHPDVPRCSLEGQTAIGAAIVQRNPAYLLLIVETPNMGDFLMGSM